MANIIVLFQGELNTLNVFTNQMKDGFEKLGYQVYMYDLQNSIQSFARLYDLIQQESVLAMIGFNSHFFGMVTKSGVNVWEQMGIPCVNILVDHPYWYREMLTQMPSNSVVLCVDRNHMNFVNRFYKHIAMNGFLPHGGTKIENDLKPLIRREVDVFYAGSLYASEAKRMEPNFMCSSVPMEEICEETIEYLLCHPSGTIEETFELHLKKRIEFMEEYEILDYMSACGYIERVVSSYMREKCLSRIAKDGIPLTLCGTGWEECDWITLPNVRYEKMISPEAVLDTMEKSKIVLNTLPWFKDGTHERIFNGMLRGCVVVSEKSEYLNEILPENTWVGFEISEQAIQTLPEKIKYLLNHLEIAQEIANAGYALAVEKHTWQMRAKEMHEDLLKYL